MSRNRWWMFLFRIYEVMGDAIYSVSGVTAYFITFIWRCLELVIAVLLGVRWKYITIRYFYPDWEIYYGGILSDAWMAEDGFYWRTGREGEKRPLLLQCTLLVLPAGVVTLALLLS